MYLLHQTVPVEAVPALVAGVGYVGQIATDPDTDDVYVNFGGQWTKLVDGNGEPVQMTVTSAQITDATAVGRSVLTAADAAAARTAIGAGTSNLALGTTAATALAGNGTAAAATKLATARTINGQSFDGTANVTIGAADIEAPAFTTAGGTVIAAGTVAAQMKAIADLADPAAA